MREAECDSVLALWLDLVEHHRSLDPSFPAGRGLAPALRRELERALREPQCRLLVAELGGRVCGFALAEVEGENTPDAAALGGCWIHELFVEPAARGRGVGSQLVACAEDFFAQHGSSRVSVRVEALNRAGLRFWRGRGFGERARVLERAL
jgi:ribosomal protein S18 acetylase RimI-like enzyme